MNLYGILVEIFAFYAGLGWGWEMPEPYEGLGEGAFRSSWTGAHVPGGGGRMETRESCTINQPLKGSVDVPEVSRTC